MLHLTTMNYTLTSTLFLSSSCRTGVAVCRPPFASELTSSNALAQEAEFTLEMVLRVDHERVSWSAVTQIVS
jgi:hypothetical protein